MRQVNEVLEGIVADLRGRGYSMAAVSFDGHYFSVADVAIKDGDGQICTFRIAVVGCDELSQNRQIVS